MYYQPCHRSNYPTPSQRAIFCAISWRALLCRYLTENRDLPSSISHPFYLRGTKRDIKTDDMCGTSDPQHVAGVKASECCSDKFDTFDKGEGNKSVIPDNKTIQKCQDENFKGASQGGCCTSKEVGVVREDKDGCNSDEDGEREVSRSDTRGSKEIQPAVKDCCTLDLARDKSGEAMGCCSVISKVVSSKVRNGGCDTKISTLDDCCRPFTSIDAISPPKDCCTGNVSVKSDKECCSDVPRQKESGRTSKSTKSKSRAAKLGDYPFMGSRVEAD
jgi:hypothetical protein